MASSHAPGDSDGTFPADSTAPSTSPPNSGRSFVTQQFSAATEAILKRIRGEPGALNPNITLGGTSTASLYATPGAIQPTGYENVRNRLLEGMKTSESIEIPSTAPSSSKKSQKNALAKSVVASGTSHLSSSNGGSGSKPRSRAPKSRAGAKRKRVKDESESAEESGNMSGLGGDSDSDAGSITQFPTQTLSGRKVVKPTQFVPPPSDAPTKKRAANHFKKTGKNVESALCKRCSRGNSPATNMIVFCDGCNNGWHQMCHDPMISDLTVTDQTAAWYCRDCASKKSRMRGSSNATDKISLYYSKTTDEQLTYLATFPKEHLIKLLHNATLLHPNTPILPPHSSTPQKPVDRRTNVHSQQPFPPSATTGLFTRSEANPVGKMNFIRKIDGTTSTLPPSSTTAATPTPEPQHAASASSVQPESRSDAGADATGFEMSANGNGNEDGSGTRESTPASPPYPRPGTGMMARLPPDMDDLEWLVGSGDDPEAYTHIVFGQGGE